MDASAVYSFCRSSLTRRPTPAKARAKATTSRRRFQINEKTFVSTVPAARSVVMLFAHHRSTNRSWLRYASCVATSDLLLNRRREARTTKFHGPVPAEIVHLPWSYRFSPKPHSLGTMRSRDKLEPSAVGQDPQRASQTSFLISARTSSRGRSVRIRSKGTSSKRRLELPSCRERTYASGSVFSRF